MKMGRCRASTASSTAPAPSSVICSIMMQCMSIRTMSAASQPVCWAGCSAYRRWNPSHENDETICRPHLRPVRGADRQPDALVPAAFAATKAQLPDLPSSQCVVDDANILSSSTKTAIENLNAQLTQQCEGAQIGVLTVDYTGSLSTEDYAVQAANTWGLGSSSKNNGVLILLVMQSQQYADGDYYLATGDGFRNTTLEKQASAIAQTMEDSFAAGDYDAAVTTCANNVASTIADLYGVT